MVLDPVRVRVAPEVKDSVTSQVRGLREIPGAASLLPVVKALKVQVLVENLLEIPLEQVRGLQVREE